MGSATVASSKGKAKITGSKPNRQTGVKVNTKTAPANETPAQKTLSQQIAEALAAARKSKTGLVGVCDLPTPWQYNPYVLTGYRFTASAKECLRSVLRWHNESFNIWSHLLGALFILGLLVRGGWWYGLQEGSTAGSGGQRGFLIALVYGVYLLAALLCTTCSVAWHTMRCIADHGTVSLYSSLDLTGVTTLVIASVLVTQLVAFEAPPSSSSSALPFTTQNLSLLVSLLLGAAALAGCWLPLMLRPGNSWARVLVWIALGVQGAFVPAAWLLWARGAAATAAAYAPLLPAYAPIFLGAVVYAAQFPECVWPGRFDYLGGSHNILHVLALWAIWMGVDALREIARSAA